MLSIQVERTEKRIEAISMHPFIDPKDANKLIREMRMVMQETIRKYNDLVID